MISFSYQAKDNQGKTIRGIVEAPNEKKAAHLLREKGLLVISLVSTEKQFSLKRVLDKFKKVSFSDIVSFTNQLSTMITAGLPLLDALEILKTQFKNPVLNKMIGEIADDIRGGSSLTEVLKKYPQHFSPTYICLIEAGEASGKLSEVLERLSDNLEKQRSFKGKIKGAMIYPTIVMSAMGVVIFIMMSFVVPKLSSLYEDFDIPLPLHTQILISFSSFFASFWWLILILVLAGAFLFNSWKKTPFGKKIYDSFLLSIPIFSEINKKMILVEFTRTLGVLVGAGVPILSALKILSSSVENVVYEEAINRVGQGVERGFPLGTLLLADPVFPPILGQMAIVGEETGKIDEALFKISSYFEQEGDRAVKGLTTALEPIIMIILGVGVGFLVMSIIVPIYNLTGQF